MATSSITKNFVISGERQVKMFADAIEASANDRTPRITVSASQLRGTDELRQLMMKRNMNYLEKVISDIEAGRATLVEHDIIED